MVAQDLGTDESICWQNGSFSLVEPGSFFFLSKDFRHITLESEFSGRKRESSVVKL